MSYLNVFLFTFGVLIHSISYAASIKAVIFDCDGTLIDNGSGYFLCWQYALEQQGYILTSDEFWHFMDENDLVGAPNSEEMILKFCFERLGRDSAVELLHDVRVASMHLHATYDFPVIEPTVAFLRQLVEEKQQLGLRVGLASGGTRDHIQRNLKRLGLENCFDAIVSGADDLSHYTDPEGTNKPKPYVYLHAAKILGLLPEECAAIEDSWVGVSSAVTAGCVTVAVPNAYTAKQNVSHAHLKITSFAGIAPIEFLELITY